MFSLLLPTHEVSCATYINMRQEMSSYDRCIGSDRYAVIEFLSIILAWALFYEFRNNIGM